MSQDEARNYLVKFIGPEHFSIASDGTVEVFG